MSNTRSKSFRPVLARLMAVSMIAGGAISIAGTAYANDNGQHISFCSQLAEVSGTPGGYAVATGVNQDNQTVTTDHVPLRGGGACDELPDLWFKGMVLIKWFDFTSMLVETTECAVPVTKRSDVMNCDDIPVHHQLLDWMSREVATNLQSDEFNNIKTLLAINRPAGLVAWALMVKPDAPWDHKPYVENTYGGSSYLLADGRFYFQWYGTADLLSHDYWSNFHYGYVGRAAGITGIELRIAHQAPGTGETDDGDILTVDMGIEFFDTKGLDSVDPTSLDGWLHQFRNQMAAVSIVKPLENQPPRITTDSENVTVDEGAQATNSGTVTDFEDDPVTLTASVGVATVSADRWEWTLPAADRGQRTVIITASDGNGGTSSVSFTLNGTDTPPTVDAGPPVVGDEGTAIALLGSAGDRTAPPAVTWSYVPLSGVDPGTSCSFADPHSAQTTIGCTDDGEFTATLTADDGVNPAVSDSTTVTVRNAPPVLTLAGPQPWQVFRAGTPVDLSASFTDAANDTHTCSVNWDDGTDESYPPNPGRTCDRTHTFGHPGMYTIKVKVTDDDGGFDSADVMVIVYDPDAGFATAAGQVNSPASSEFTSPLGALANSAAQGSAHFTFNPKYLPGDSTPVPSGGKVDFRLGEDLRLDSTALEWLVVTPDDKVAVKGVATLADRDGEYGFVLYGYDGDPDRYRLVVWSLADGPIPSDNLTYDNRRGLSFDLDEADPQAITSGSIQVHN